MDQCKPWAVIRFGEAVVMQVMNVLDAPKTAADGLHRPHSGNGDMPPYFAVERPRLGSNRGTAASGGRAGGSGKVREDTAVSLTPEIQAALLHDIATRGDRAAFARLFAYFGPRLRAFLIRGGSDPVQAEELTQDVFLSVWRRADSFDPNQASVATWIFTIARNRRIDVFRRGNRPALDPEDPALVPAPETAPDDWLEAAQQSRRLSAAMKELPEAQASLLRMAFYEDKAHSEIAEETGLPLGTVKSRLRLAIAKMRTGLGVV